MRQGFYGFLLLMLVPSAAPAGEAFSVPSSGVLAPKSVAALYDSGSITTGRPVGATPATEIRSHPKTSPAKPKARAVAPVTRSASSSYARRAARPAATLPPGVVAPPPYRPGMPPVAGDIDEPAPAASYAQPAAAQSPANTRGFFASATPAAIQAPVIAPRDQSRSMFSDLFSPGRRGGERGLFGGSGAPAPAAPLPQVHRSQLY